MLKKTLSSALVIALVCPLVCTRGETSVFANTDSEEKSSAAKIPSESNTADPNAATRNEKLRADLLKLVADAKAGKVTPAEHPQIRAAKSNNLSKKTKIAIGVGIAAAVVVVVLMITSPRLNR